MYMYIPAVMEWNLHAVSMQTGNPNVVVVLDASGSFLSKVPAAAPYPVPVPPAAINMLLRSHRGCGYHHGSDQK